MGEGVSRCVLDGEGVSCCVLDGDGVAPGDAAAHHAPSVTVMRYLHTSYSDTADTFVVPVPHLKATRA